MRYIISRAFQDDPRLHRLRPAHRTYWRGLMHQGVLIGGGIWEEGRREVLVVKAQDRAAVHRLLGADPYTQERLTLDVTVQGMDDLLGAEDRAECAVPAAGEAAGDAEPAGRLSAHELRVARMMLDGLTNRQIAEHFMVSPRAVEQHITRIYRKLSISRRAQLAVALRGERLLAS
ncbi:LuxR C-terminal-related transcriptional regulator (plasmid) [Streptomyces sp. NBC_00704]|uniref:LuxR C-terminal-related transcriptional regulator n=1 Tax=Streptomyces sp. NBC_00704 TaxID=2975809 RepID=UPI002E36362A|nr:LuxR C-terminal-related transcriptional regulator [Streptomyces sp. NBC_00704]